MGDIFSDPVPERESSHLDMKMGVKGLHEAEMSGPGKVEGIFLFPTSTLERRFGRAKEVQCV